MSALPYSAATPSLAAKLFRRFPKWRFLRRSTTALLIVCVLAAGLADAVAPADAAAAPARDPVRHTIVDDFPDVFPGWHTAAQNCGFWGCTNNFAATKSGTATWHLVDVRGVFVFGRNLPNQLNEAKDPVTGRLKWTIWEQPVGESKYNKVRTFYPPSQEGRDGWFAYSDDPIELDGKVAITATTRDSGKLVGVQQVRLRYVDLANGDKSIAVILCQANALNEVQQQKKLQLYLDFAYKINNLGLSITVGYLLGIGLAKLPVALAGAIKGVTTIKTAAAAAKVAANISAAIKFFQDLRTVPDAILDVISFFESVVEFNDDLVEAGLLEEHSPLYDEYKSYCNFQKGTPVDPFTGKLDLLTGGGRGSGCNWIQRFSCVPGYGEYELNWVLSDELSLALEAYLADDSRPTPPTTTPPTTTPPTTTPPTTTPPPSGTFQAVTAGGFHSCGLRTDGTAQCWGYNGFGQTDAPTGAFTAITAGDWHSCGLRTDGTAQCWGSNISGQTDAPTGTFTAITAGGFHSCGLRTDGTAQCWGYNGFGRADAPSGAFTAITAGDWHSCGLRTDGTAQCWGENYYGQTDAPSGAFTAITAGYWHSCGLRTDGTAKCWGNNFSGQTDAPTGTFSAITAGGRHSCGLRTDGTAQCWGDNGYGRADAPSGAFSAITAGGRHSCGLRTDGTAQCWGNNDYGQTDAPSGAFTAITAGDWHSCGLRTDGTAQCWGYNGFGRADAPSGAFTAITAGGFHSCGLRTDGTAQCWGENDSVLAGGRGGEPPPRLPAGRVPGDLRCPTNRHLVGELYRISSA